MGEVPEWTIGAVSKTVEVLAGLRGFESHPLRWLGKWGLGTGDWGLEIRDWGLGKWGLGIRGWGNGD